MEDRLGRRFIVLRLGLEDIRHKGLRIAVIEREPARLDLHHDAMTRQERVVGGRERETIALRRVRRDRRGMREALPIAAAENVHGDGKLIARHFRP